MATSVAQGFRVCPKCGKEKALNDTHWYRHKSRNGGWQSYCRKCMNMLPKPATTARISRNRARQRASQILIERHRDEFQEIYDNEYAEALEEAWRLAADPANAHFEGSVVRLRTGPKRQRSDEGEVREVAVQERVNVDWCPKCSMFHARDHHLTAKQIREADLSESFEEYTAGVELARQHAR